MVLSRRAVTRPGDGLAGSWARTSAEARNSRYTRERLAPTARTASRMRRTSSPPPYNSTSPITQPSTSGTASYPATCGSAM